jgi:hypothetical protein
LGAYRIIPLIRILRITLLIQCCDQVPDWHTISCLTHQRLRILVIDRGAQCVHYG